MKILVIEKNQVVRNSIRHILEKEGYDISVASNGKEGMALLSDIKFEIVMTNINLPYYSGFEIIGYIRNTLQNTECKIVIISSNLSAVNMHRLYKMGIDDMIEKPFIPMELICRLEKLCEYLSKK